MDIIIIHTKDDEPLVIMHYRLLTFQVMQLIKSNPYKLKEKTLAPIRCFKEFTSYHCNLNQCSGFDEGGVLQYFPFVNSDVPSTKTPSFNTFEATIHT